ncbi:Hcp1 family type VI secretion system effector [Salmonella enterica subsp. enterica]|uniref:Hcp1 family type VI secretion system effector n=1 Tax=Salmonella enterica I TaxID=59201 RepID=A0A379WZ62_SALET|nr:Hcp1 family type VI secretion system effector [Salmonella enterica subsp. enterica]
MAYDIFLKIDGIDGESMDDKHKNEIEVLSWRWNIHQESTMHAGSGLGSGKVSVTNLDFDHYIDRASPNLFKYCASASTFRRPFWLCVRLAAIRWSTSSIPSPT